MGKGSGWLIALLVVALLGAACGPEMATPTSSTESAGASPSATVADASPPATAEDAGGTPDSRPAKLPVDPDDWHVLGSPDAEVTIIEYSDFQ